MLHPDRLPMVCGTRWELQIPQAEEYAWAQGTESRTMTGMWRAILAWLKPVPRPEKAPRRVGVHWFIPGHGLHTEIYDRDKPSDLGAWDRTASGCLALVLYIEPA